MWFARSKASSDVRNFIKLNTGPKIPPTRSKLWLFCQPNNEDSLAFGEVDCLFRC